MKNKNTRPTRGQFKILRQICNYIPPHEVAKLALKQAHCDPPETGAEKKSRKFSQNLPIPHTAAFCCTGKRPLAGDLRVGLRFWSFFHV
jgi:hypothetical protein